ncbi:ethylene-responsive transcription factor ERF017-like [Syzygium oleosum]|uniref:ethylene-responsive transcription factor ERF017-like n=1 Tax=Syzygium oleosum TaxID=219896 RepID=UPI0024B8D683|nr:ethylene-responsive transcription factor ERF017-like [Syzygium oleosum]
MVMRSAAAAGLAVRRGSGARSDPKFRGVRQRRWGKWVSEIRFPNSPQRLWLGSYDSPVKAARAFDAALFCIRGPTANFNFPDSPPEIPGGGSLTPPEIKAAAAWYAESGPMPAWLELPGSASLAPPPSPSVSEASSVLTIENDLYLDVSSSDLSAGPEPGSGELDLGEFPGIEECPSDFNGMQFPSLGSLDLNLDVSLALDFFFLWGF